MDYEEEEITFVEERVSSHYYCAICTSLFQNPMVLSCGHSLCSSCISKLDTTNANTSCPLCRRKINLLDAHPNIIVTQLISELKVYCKYKRYGCDDIITIGSKKDHEQQCTYKLINCKWSIKGCKITGTKYYIEQEHYKTCPFELLSPLLNHLESAISILQSQLLQQQQLLNLNNSNVNHLLLNDINSFNNNNNDNSNSNISSANNANNGNNNNKNNKWDKNSLKCIETISGHNRGVTAIAYDINKQYLFTASHDCTIRVWSLNKIMGKETQLQEISITIDNSSNNSGSSSNSNNNNSNSNSNNNSNSSSDDKGIECIKVLEGQHTYTIWSLVVNKEYLYSGSSDSTIVQWNIETLIPINKIKAHTGKIYSLDISDNLLFSTGNDRRINVWNCKSMEKIEEIYGHTDCINALFIFNNHLYSASDDFTIRKFDLNNFQCIKVITQDESNINSNNNNSNNSNNNESITMTRGKILSIAVNDKIIVAGTQNCKVIIWDNVTYNICKVISEHSWEVWQVSLYDQYLISASFDHQIKLFDLNTFTLIKTLQGHKGYIHSILISYPFLFSASGDKTIKIWK